MQLNPNESSFTIRIDIQNETFVGEVVSINDIDEILFGGGGMRPTQINAVTPDLQLDSAYQLLVYAIVDFQLDTMRESVAEMRTLSELYTYHIFMWLGY